MPAFNGVAAGAHVDKEKRSSEEIASNVTSVLLMLIVVFFVGISLWLGVFAIPAFFAFFRASVVTVSSVREVRVCLPLRASRAPVCLLAGYTVIRSWVGGIGFCFVS